MGLDSITGNDIQNSQPITKNIVHLADGAINEDFSNYEK
jgi:hypothetical protein